MFKQLHPWTVHLFLRLAPHLLTVMTRYLGIWGKNRCAFVIHIQCMDMHMHIPAYTPPTHTCTHMHPHTHMHVHTRTHTHVCTLTYTTPAATPPKKPRLQIKAKLKRPSRRQWSHLWHTSMTWMNSTRSRRSTGKKDVELEKDEKIGSMTWGWWRC